jgi:hypothetical protein
MPHQISRAYHTQAPHTRALETPFAVGGDIVPTDCLYLMA